MTRFAIVACLALAGCTCTCTPFSFSSSSHTSSPDGDVAIVNGVRLAHPRTLAASWERPPRELDLSFGAADLTVIGVPGATTASAEADVFEKEPGDAELVFTETGVSLKGLSGVPPHLKHLTVRVPVGTPVALKTSAGEIRVSGLAGIPFIRLQVGSGDIDLTQVTQVARLEATSSMGDIRVAGSQGIASASLQASSGNITLEDLAQLGDLGAKTSLGDIRALRSDFEHLKAHTSSGDIDCRTSTYRSRDFRTSMGEVLEGNLIPRP